MAKYRKALNPNKWEVKRRLTKNVNLTGETIERYFDKIPATKPKLSPWLNMPLKDLYQMNLDYTTKRAHMYPHPGRAKHEAIERTFSMLSGLSQQGHKFGLNNKEYFSDASINFYNFRDEKSLHFKLISKDATEAMDIGEYFNKHDGDIEKFLTNSNLVIKGIGEHPSNLLKQENITRGIFNEIPDEQVGRILYANPSGRRKSNSPGTLISLSEKQTSPWASAEYIDKERRRKIREQDLANKKAKKERKEQKKFNENWEAHLKQEEAKELDTIQRMYDAEKVESRYRTDRQAELESVFTNYEEPQITSGVTMKEARSAAVKNAGPEVMQGEAIDPVTKTKSKLGIKKGEGNYRFPPQEHGPMTFPKYKMTEKGLVNQRVTQEAAEEVVEGAVNIGNPYFKQVFSGRNIGAVLNLGFAISDYNQARNAGDGVIKAGAKAGAQFVAGEMLGGWMMPVMLAKQVPTMAISAIEGTQKITRQMNNTGRIQTFGEAEFRDTQQLATMRQAGMELAKMSQYNLQQSIMGNEAQYMHRL